MIKINSYSKQSNTIIKGKRVTPFCFKYTGQRESMISLYVFVEYVQRLESLFQQDKMNVSFGEMARLISRNTLRSDNISALEWG